MAEVKIINNESELLELAIEMANQGIKPKEFEVSKIEYPVSITITDTEFFKTPPAPEPEVVVEEKPKKKKNVKKIVAITVGSIVAVAIIVTGICLAVC